MDAARLAKSLLDTLGMKSFVKTTGGSGVHVVVPIDPDLDWPAMKDFTRRIALMLAKARAELFVANMSKSRRGGRIFVDYMRNGAEIRVAVAAYSARARAGATVSTPLAWDELDRTDTRDRFTLTSIPARLGRLRADPWRDYCTTRQSITTTMRAALAAA